MKLGIDARLISQTGVGVYVDNLLHNLVGILPKDWEVNVYVCKEDAQLVPPRMNVRIAPFRWHSLSEQTSFLHMLNHDKLDLMHFTYFSFPTLYNRPFVSTIHDLTPVLFKTGKASTKSSLEYYPKYFAMKHVIKQAVKNAGGIITPTATVKNQLAELYGADKNHKIFVTYEGISDKLANAKENKELRKQFGTPFMMYIGNFYPHKNISRLLHAYKQIDTSIALLLVGPDDFFCHSTQDEVKKLGLGSRIRFYHNPSLSDLVFFYKNARALIHPSLSEGFGLTPIEAMYFGCPVVASDIPVFHETMENQYLSFNPKDTTSIQAAIELFLTKVSPFETKNILAKFSFKTMAAETLRVYKQIIGV